MIIILHSSKTMKLNHNNSVKLSEPIFIDKAVEIDKFLKNLNEHDLSKKMQLSTKLATQTKLLINSWKVAPKSQVAAASSFVGDIFSGLQASSWDDKDIDFASKHLYILSGLYGVLKPFDGIYPYRLEMGYKLSPKPYKNLYEFWGDSITNSLPSGEDIVNLSSLEYFKTISPFIDKTRVISPIFMTLSTKTNQPTAVTIHSKIARGAFANWMIKNKVTNKNKLNEFNDLGYRFSDSLSELNKPVFVCNEFMGLGLSIRLK